MFGITKSRRVQWVLIIVVLVLVATFTNKEHREAIMALARAAVLVFTE
jgi:hypothetical protein